MTAQMGRPEEFVERKREMFCALVGVGVSRRHAAASVGVAPSTVTRHMAADPLFDEAVRDAECGCELDLMKRIRLQSERSWRAAVWLLERMRPERYARGKSAPVVASWDEMFDKFVALIDQEVADEALRERLTARLDEMAFEELAAQELDRMETAPPKSSSESSLAQMLAALKDRAGSHAPSNDPQPAASVSQSKPIQAVAERSTASPKPSANTARPQTSTASRKTDFCNTSPDALERRWLASIGS